MTADPYTTLAATLSTESAGDRLTDLKQWLSSLVPGVDVDGPVINTLLLYPIAERQAAIESYINVLRDYSLLRSLPLDSVFDDELRKDIRALQTTEFGLDDVAGRAASGVVQLEFSATGSWVIPAGTFFTSSGGQAINTQAYIVKPEITGTTQANVQRLTPKGDTFVANIPVVMIETGVAGNVAVGTPFTLGITLTNLIAARAVTGFVGGQDEYDVGTLISNFFDNRVFGSLGSRDQIVALLRSRADLGDIRSVGIVGFGDQEMHRDKVNFIPGGSGRTDLYVASSSFPSSLPATLSGQATARETAGNQRYVISVGRDVAPGFLEIEGVVDSATGRSLRVISVTRGLDLQPILGEQVPAIPKISQGTFSRFQTASVVVEDTNQVYDAGLVAARSFEVTFRYHPGIANIQTLVGDRSTRFAGGDTLVRSAFPLMIAMQVRMRSVGSDSVPEATQLRRAVLAEISRQPMRPALYASDIIAAISPYLRTTLAVYAVDFYATYIGPDGEVVSINGQNELHVPVLPEKQISPRTVAMYSSSESIRFTVEQLLAPEIP